MDSKEIKRFADEWQERYTGESPLRFFLVDRDEEAKAKAAEKARDRSLARAVAYNIHTTTPGGFRPRTRFPWKALAAVVIVYLAALAGMVRP